MPDYRRNQNKNGGDAFADAMKSFTQKVEELDKQFRDEVRDGMQAIGVSLTDLTKTISPMVMSVPELVTNNLKVKDDMGLMVKGMADIISYLYKKEVKPENFGTMFATDGAKFT